LPLTCGSESCRLDVDPNVRSPGYPTGHGLQHERYSASVHRCVVALLDIRFLARRLDGRAIDPEGILNTAVDLRKTMATSRR
jgi:hypothetical protein